MAGKFIVIEGLDGAGTTTQAKLLKNYLASLGFKVLSSAEPTSSPIGVEIRRLLALPIEKEQNMLVTLALCFAADRMQHMHETLIPGLKDHDFLIVDRYVLSSLVYQGLHLPTAFIKEINSYALKPDLTMVLDVDVAIAAERLSRRAGTKDFYETPPLLSKIRSRYLHFAQENPSVTVLLSGNDSVEHVHSHLVHVINDRFVRTIK